MKLSRTLFPKVSQVAEVSELSLNHKIKDMEESLVGWDHVGTPRAYGIQGKKVSDRLNGAQVSAFWRLSNSIPRGEGAAKRYSRNVVEELVSIDDLLCLIPCAVKYDDEILVGQLDLFTID